MTFDDGILTIYEVENSAPPGEKPVASLKEKGRYYYGYDQIGITRYYQALQAERQIEAVVNIPGWENIQVADVVVMQERPNIQYQVGFVQPGMDDDGLRITKLTLERIG